MSNTAAKLSLGTERYPLIDHLRTLAILAMIFYHATYDLVLFQLVRVNLRSFAWEMVPNTIVATFLFCVGASLGISHFPQPKWTSYLRRLSKIAVGALIVSIITRILFPTQWVYFGTLHVITLATLLAIPFLKYPKTAFVTGLSVILLPSITGISVPWIKLTHSSIDYIPPVPWFGFTLLGIAAFHAGAHRLRVPALKVSEWISRHSLKIYLLHQVILFGLTWVIAKLSRLI